MHVFNGTLHMVDPRPVAPVCIDACNMGAGAYFMGDGVYTQWLPEVASKVHINVKEILAVEPAAIRWAPVWANKRIYVHSDNIAAVAAINKGTCKDLLGREALRRVFWLSALYNFRLRAVYYAGRYNTIADAISRIENVDGMKT